MIGVTWKLILGGLWRPLLAVLGAAGLYVKGRADAKAKADLRDLNGFKKTTERMQDADAAMGDDPAVLRDSLRQRDPNKP
jgi:hypothetical protein